MKAHANVIVATDFFCKTVWTPLGKRVAYGLVFIHLGSRKVFVSPGTYHPDEAWVLQQARNATMWLEDEGLEMRYLLRDRDMKYSAALDRPVVSEGAETIRSPYRSPVANCYAESWIGSLKRECLNHFFCFGLRRFDHIVQATPATTIGTDRIRGSATYRWAAKTPPSPSARRLRWDR